MDKVGVREEDADWFFERVGLADIRIKLARGRELKVGASAGAKQLNSTTNV
jgi:hypothetical protein